MGTRTSSCANPRIRETTKQVSTSISSCMNPAIIFSRKLEERKSKRQKDGTSLQPVFNFFFKKSVWLPRKMIPKLIGIACVENRSDRGCAGRFQIFFLFRSFSRQPNAKLGFYFSFPLISCVEY